MYPYHIYDRTEWGARPARAVTTQPTIKEVFFHHSESADAAKISSVKQMISAVRNIQDYHMDVKRWNDIAYHFIVFQPDGNHRHATAFRGRPTFEVPAAQLNHNTMTLAICVYGDGNREQLSDHTVYAIESLVRTYAPHAVAIGGHRDVVATECPGDRFYAWLPHLSRETGLRQYKR